METTVPVREVQVIEDASISWACVAYLDGQPIAFIPGGLTPQEKAHLLKEVRAHLHTDN